MGVYECVWVCRGVCVCMAVCMGMCMGVWVCVHGSVGVYMSMYGCVLGSVDAWERVRVRAYESVYRWLHGHACVCTWQQLCMGVHAKACV